MHQRQAICEKVCELLKAADTAAGERVYPNRFLPLRVKDLPAILVYTLSERVDPDSISTAPRELTRLLELAVDAIVAVTDDVDNDLSAIALEIETALHADPYFDSTAGESILTDTDIGVEPDGDRFVGRVALTYEVTYRTLAPEVVADDDMDDFETARVTQSLRGAQAEADRVSDEFVVQELP